MEWKYRIKLPVLMDILRSMLIGMPLSRVRAPEISDMRSSVCPERGRCMVGMFVRAIINANEHRYRNVQLSSHSREG
jgi:hypothetical protein